jgi:hypothetical protein
MKAKVKATGKVVEAVIDKCSVPASGYGAKFVYDCSDGKKYFDTELDFINVYPDWQQIRIQASIAAMQGCLANNTFYATKENTIKSSVGFADELINKLQKEMEE